MVEWRWCDLEEYHVLSLNYLEYFISWMCNFSVYDCVQYMFSLDTD